MNYDRIDFVRDNISVTTRVSSIEPPRDARARELMVEQGSTLQMALD